MTELVRRDYMTNSETPTPGGFAAPGPALNFPKVLGAVQQSKSKPKGQWAHLSLFCVQVAADCCSVQLTAVGCICN